jgi:hypothetical protein
MLRLYSAKHQPVRIHRQACGTLLAGLRERASHYCINLLSKFAAEDSEQTKEI